MRWQGAATDRTTQRRWNMADFVSRVSPAWRDKGVPFTGSGEVGKVLTMKEECNAYQ